MKFIKFIILIAIITVVSSRATYAQSLSLSLWPPLLEVTIQPGRSIVQTYKISNLGETDLELLTYVSPFRPADELGNVEEISDKKYGIGQAEAINWFSLQDPSLSLGEKFSLKAGQNQDITLGIDIPRTAQEDDYYLTLFFQTSPPPESIAPSNTQSQMKIGANILLTVSQTGEPTKKAEIIQFSILNSKFSIIDSFDKPEFLVRIKNIGRTFFKPMGTISVNGWFGQNYNLDLLPTNILVNSTREISCAKLNSDETDSTPVPCQISSGFLLGQYRAKLQFNPGNSLDYATELVFWAIPIKLLIGLFTTILLVFSVLNRFRLGLDKKIKQPIK